MHRTEAPSVFACLCLMFTVVLTGCGSAELDIGVEMDPTFKVTGKVVVDGAAPKSPIQVKAHLPYKSEKKRRSAGITGEDGVFELTTYQPGDGIPPGEYSLTFLGPSMAIGGLAPKTDSLGGRYTDPRTSQFSVTVTESDDVQDLGIFELESAPEPTLIPDDRR